MKKPKYADIDPLYKYLEKIGIPTRKKLEYIRNDFFINLNLRQKKYSRLLEAYQEHKLSDKGFVDKVQDLIEDEVDNYLDRLITEIKEYYDSINTSPPIEDVGKVLSMMHRIANEWFFNGEILFKQALKIAGQPISPKESPTHLRMIANRIVEKLSNFNDYLYGILYESTSFRAGEGYASVYWRGHRFSFTKKQAYIIELLHEQWKMGCPDVRQDTLLDSLGIIGKDARLRQVFRKHDAWGTLIIHAEGSPRGTYRLDI